LLGQKRETNIVNERDFGDGTWWNIFK
jgi:hypothetical protein